VYRGYSYCCLLTELPPNIPVAEELNEKVTFDGYFYKIYRFRAGDTTRRAPLMIGRSIALRHDEQTPVSLADEAFMTLPLLLAGLIGLIAIAAGIVLWFHWSDRRTKLRLEAARGRRVDDVPTPDVFHDPNPLDGSPSLN
jgi:hypothetical protein